MILVTQRTFLGSVISPFMADAATVALTLLV